MKVKYNKVFLQLLADYKLPTDLSFDCEIPAAVREILDSEILHTEFGITLQSLNKLRAANEPWETRSIIEDEENHFHVDWYTPDEEGAFRLGVKTLFLLAGKFEVKEMTGIRFSYSFQTQALSLRQAQDMQLHEEGDEYYSGDRVSFFQREADDNIVNDEMFNSAYFAILVIDI